MRLTIFMLAASFLVCCKSTNYKYPHVLIGTQFGDIELELYPDKAPKTVNAFLSYIDSGYYKTSSFYRVLNVFNQPSHAFKAELIQGGIYKTNPKKYAAVPGVPHETTQQTGLLHKTGTISLARAEPGTGGTEFFICLEDQPGFDFGGMNNPDGQGYAAFGMVVKGMDVVRTIYGRPDYDQSFYPPVPIFWIRKL